MEKRGFFLSIHNSSIHGVCWFMLTVGKGAGGWEVTAEREGKGNGRSRGGAGAGAGGQFFQKSRRREGGRRRRRKGFVPIVKDDLLFALQRFGQSMKDDSAFLSKIACH
jgi:hypothetical protein